MEHVCVWFARAGAFPRCMPKLRVRWCCVSLHARPVPQSLCNRMVPHGGLCCAPQQHNPQMAAVRPTHCPSPGQCPCCGASSLGKTWQGAAISGMAQRKLCRFSPTGMFWPPPARSRQVQRGVGPAENCDGGARGISVLLLETGLQSPRRARGGRKGVNSGILTLKHWRSGGFAMDAQWTPNGLPMDSPMDSQWTPTKTIRIATAQGKSYTY